jgi:hypothetical protein
MATPLTAEIATRMIREKVADAIAENQRLEICRRHSAIEGLLPAEAAITHHNAFHIWLRLRAKLAA